VETLYREALGELAIRYDSIYKIAWGGKGETYILYCNTNRRVYDCIREIGLLLPDETCFHSQIMFTYRLPVLSHGSNCKRLQTTLYSIYV